MFDFGEEMESLREPRDGSVESDPSAFDDLPFVVTSKRITIEWPVSLLRSLRIKGSEGGGGSCCCDCSELDLQDVEISNVFNRDKEEEVGQNCGGSLTLHEDHQTAETEVRLRETKSVSIKLKYMQVYMMGGYAWRHFYDRRQDKYCIWVEIKSQGNQIIKSVNMLEERSGGEGEVRRSPPPPPQWSSSLKRSSFEYRRFISSQINASRRAFQLDVNQYKIQLFKILNYKISVGCGDQVHLDLTNGSGKSNRVTLPITRESLAKLARHGGFQILLELREGLLDSDSRGGSFRSKLVGSSLSGQEATHDRKAPGTRVGYVLLSVQKDGW